MNIIYKTTKEFTSNELIDLFGKRVEISDKLIKSIKNSDTVFSAWENDKLIGLINAIDDGAITAYVNLFFVKPEFNRSNINVSLINLLANEYLGFNNIVMLGAKEDLAYYEDFNIGRKSDKVSMLL